MNKTEHTSSNHEQGNSSLGVVSGSFYTANQAKTILDSVDFPKGLTIKQQRKVLCWTIFNKKRFWRFVKSIEDGMSILFAFKDAENYR